MVHSRFSIILLFVKHLPNTEHEQENAKRTAQPIRRNHGGTIGGEGGDEAAGE